MTEHFVLENDLLILEDRYPGHIATSLNIMLEAPLGSATFNNEFGRPCLTGYFRTLLTRLPIGDGQEELRGYHKVRL